MKATIAPLVAFLIVAAPHVRGDPGPGEWLRRAEAGAQAYASDDARAAHAIALVKEGSAAAVAPGNGANGKGGARASSWLSSAVAAAVILQRLFPEGSEQFESDLAVLASYVPESDAKAHAMARGRSAAISVLHRAGHGHDLRQ